MHHLNGEVTRHDQHTRNLMPTDETDPTPEPSNLMPVDSANPAPAPEHPSLIVTPEAHHAHFPLIHALAAILVRLDRAALAMQQSPATPMPAESAHDPE